MLFAETDGCYSFVSVKSLPFLESSHQSLTSLRMNYIETDSYTLLVLHIHEVKATIAMNMVSSPLDNISLLFRNTGFP